MKFPVVFLIVGMSASLALPTQSAPAAGAVAYPEGYRSWSHVKSGAIGPTHASFASIGGFQHVYANAEAMTGYRTRVFPEGSIIAFDWLEMREKDGAFEEGPRRQLDVMVKDSKRFASTGGWGFQRIAGSSKTEVAAMPTPLQCFGCHDQLKKDGLVLSSYRP
jgi:cytochrome P460